LEGKVKHKVGPVVLLKKYIILLFQALKISFVNFLQYQEINWEVGGG